MTDNIKHFPRGQKRRDRLSFIKNRVPCQVSERWLQFPQEASELSGGDFMRIDVMTKSGESDRKLCELVLTKQDLLRMIEKVKTRNA